MLHLELSIFFQHSLFASSSHLRSILIISTLSTLSTLFFILTHRFLPDFLSISILFMSIFSPYSIGFIYFDPSLVLSVSLSQNALLSFSCPLQQEKDILN